MGTAEQVFKVKGQGHDQTECYDGGGIHFGSVWPRRSLVFVPAPCTLASPSSCLAIVSAVMVGGLFLWPALRYGTGYQTV